MYVANTILQLLPKISKFGNEIEKKTNCQKLFKLELSLTHREHG